jgi:hypothetical protein
MEKGVFVERYVSVPKTIAERFAAIFSFLSQ